MGNKQAGAEMTDSRGVISPARPDQYFTGGLPCVFQSEGGAEIAVAAATDRLSVR